MWCYLQDLSEKYSLPPPATLPDWICSGKSSAGLKSADTSTASRGESSALHLTAFELHKHQINCQIHLEFPNFCPPIFFSLSVFKICISESFFMLGNQESGFYKETGVVSVRDLLLTDRHILLFNFSNNSKTLKGRFACFGQP